MTIEYKLSTEKIIDYIGVRTNSPSLEHLADVDNGTITGSGCGVEILYSRACVEFVAIIENGTLQVNIRTQTTAHSTGDFFCRILSECVGQD